MKLFTTKAYRRGLAMTEYLIILAIVAIAAIVFVSVFGKQVKNAFARSSQAMAGEQAVEVDKASANKLKDYAGKGESMGTFEKHAHEQN